MLMAVLILPLAPSRHLHSFFALHPTSLPSLYFYASIDLLISRTCASPARPSGQGPTGEDIPTMRPVLVEDGARDLSLL